MYKIQSEHLEYCARRHIVNKGGWPQIERGIKAAIGQYEAPDNRKTGDFVRCVMYPGRSGRTVIDSITLRAALGIRGNGGTMSVAQSVFNRIHDWVCEIAEERDLEPEQVQAIIWIVSKRLIAEHDKGNDWFDAWVECKYAGHEKYTVDDNGHGHMPDYNIDLDVALIYASKHNLEWTLEQATPTEIADGMAWYRVANREVKAIARRHGISMHTATQVMSALSPTRNWEGNVRAADVVLDCVAVYGIE